MNQRVNQQQLDLFNQNFNIQLLEKDIELIEYSQLTKEHFETNEFEKLELNDYFGAYPIADEYLYQIVKKEKPFGKPIKIIQHTRDIENFILQEMDKVLQTKPVSIKELNFEEKLKLFNQHFKFGVIQETRITPATPLGLQLKPHPPPSTMKNVSYSKTQKPTTGPNAPNVDVWRLLKQPL